MGYAITKTNPKILMNRKPASEKSAGFNFCIFSAHREPRAESQADNLAKTTVKVDWAREAQKISKPVGVIERCDKGVCSYSLGLRSPLFGRQSKASILCGCSSMVERGFAKADTADRYRSPAPISWVHGCAGLPSRRNGDTCQKWCDYRAESTRLWGYGAN